MATVNLPPDFKEFLKLLNAHQVEYLLIGGYAVATMATRARPLLAPISFVFPLYNPHSKGVNSAQRFSPTRFICLCVGRRQVPKLR